MESHSGGLFHASTSILDQLDHSQQHFLDALGIPLAQAFIDQNFAPPTLRRNIAILGLIQKRVIGKAHPSYDKLLPWLRERTGSQVAGRHSKQLYGHCYEIVAQWRLWERSIFAMTDVYNSLSQGAVDCESVASFQSYLTSIARERCEAGNAKWMYTFDLRARHSATAAP